MRRLCDEATSALDSTTEAEILSALKSLATNRTSVFIAHRLTTAMQCDEVTILPPLVASLAFLVDATCYSTFICYLLLL